MRRKPKTAQRARSLKSRRAETALAPSPVANRPMQYVGRLIEGSSEHRKSYPVAEGLLDYFPDALAEVSNVSWVGNQKHNPGEPMHHARGKSADHANCIARHLMERGGYDTVVIDGKELRIRHTAALAWRALALLQEELETELGLSLPRGAKA